MSLTEIQKAVDTLAPDERQRLTVWMVAHYPALTVDRLMAHAGSLVERGAWVPAPPADENRPAGKVLEHAERVAVQLRRRD